ncbi:MAG: type IIL restriction-modification enzyme MmeI, partial [Betaproteobacteria bacterium]
EAWTNQPWINEGAAVRVSVIAFGRGAGERRLDGQIVDEINPDLTSRANANLLKARSLPENRGVCFMGTSKVGCFDIPGNLARSWLKLPNASGVQNSDVLRPWANGQSLAGRPADTWIIDFGTNMSLAKAAMYEAPFAYVQENVQPERKRQRRDAYRNRWWIHAEARPGLRGALRPLSRYLATPRVAKHRFFVWLPVGVLPDSRLFAICREDDFAFGVLSSRFHSVWALANASRHGIGNDPTYNASSCFETFPFPEGGKKVRNSIVQAGQRLDSLRGRWLNPSQWVDVIDSPVAHCSPRFVPKQGHEAELKLRTMTNLYNERPVWLENAPEELDRAVAGAYGWKDYTPQMPDDAILARLLKLNVYRAADLLAPLEKHLAVVRTEGGRKHPSSNASGLTSNRRKFA